MLSGGRSNSSRAASKSTSRLLTLSIAASIAVIALFIFQRFFEYVSKELTDSDFKPLYGEDSVCHDWLPEITVEGDSWKNMKRSSRPSKCPVRGYPIEELDWSHNFRRSYDLGFTTDVEDKTILLQYLRGNFDLNISKRSRRVYLDLGGNAFNTSTTWFLENYPLDFTEVHVFEAVKDLFVIPPLQSDERRGHFIPDWQLKRIKVYNAYVGVHDKKSEEMNHVNITRFIKQKLKLTKKDTLIVKMDVEGAEWAILEEWLRDPEMSLIVDELFVEVHYRHPSMSPFGWDSLTMPNGTAAPPRESALQLFVDLRKAGFYAHAWP